MKSYKVTVTITRTGTIFISANSKDEAFQKVLEMSNSEIDEIGSMTSWEPSDVEELDGD